MLTLTMKYKAPEPQGPRRVPIQGPDEKPAARAQATSTEAGPSTSQEAPATENPAEPAHEADAQDVWVEVNKGSEGEENKQGDDDVSVEGKSKEAEAPTASAEEKDDVTEDGSVEECEY